MLNQSINRTKFGTETKKYIPKTVLPTVFTSEKIQDGGVHHFEIFFNGHNPVIVEHIRTKFGIETRKNVQRTVLLSYFTSEKIRDGGGRHFEIHFNGHPGHYCVYSHKIWHSV